MKIKVILIILMLTSPVIGKAAGESPATKTAEFLALVQESKISEALDQLFMGSDINASKPQAVELLKMQIISGLPLYGKIIGFEKVREETFGNSVVRLVYVLKSERTPTIWEFYFYKPKLDWFLVNVMFNDQFQLLDAKQ